MLSARTMLIDTDVAGDDLVALAFVLSSTYYTLTARQLTAARGSAAAVDERTPPGRGGRHSRSAGSTYGARASPGPARRMGTYRPPDLSCSHEATCRTYSPYWSTASRAASATLS